MTDIPEQIPAIVEGWGASFPTATKFKSFFYDLSKALLYVILNNNQFNIFTHVQPTTATGFTNTKTPDAFFTSVNDQFSPVLLTQDGLGIMTEDGKYLVVR